MGININSLETFAQRVVKYAKANEVKNILQTKPPALKGVNFAELKLAALSKDTFEPMTAVKKSKPVLSNSIEYNSFESKVNKLSRQFASKAFKSDSKIAVEFDNINEIKEKLKPVLDEDIFKAVELFKTSDDISNILRNTFSSMNKFNYKEKDALVEFARQKGITSKLERAYNECLCNESESYKKILRIINPKSKNPDVLKIEAELNVLGIKEANFADDLEQARNIHEAVKNLVRSRISLPDSIVITPFMPNNYGGMAFAGIGNSLVILNHSSNNLRAAKINSNLVAFVKNTSEFKNAPMEYKDKYLNSLLNHKSTANVSHEFYHELGHTFQTSLKNEFVQLTPNEIEIAKGISTYGASDINEFIPEVFAKLMSGQKVDKEQADLYLKLGGIIAQG